MTSKKHLPWPAQLQNLIDTHGGMAARRAKVISAKTRAERASVLFLAHRQLIEGGYQVHDVTHLKPKHIEHLMSRWEREGLSASTLQQRLSILNTFANWIGKPGLVRPIETYLADPSRGRRTYVAQQDHSWTTAGLDIEAKLKEVAEHDRYVGMQLKVIAAFGLRRKEGVMFKPFRADKRPELNALELTSTSGTKGGRPRTVPITSEWQEQVLQEAKAMARTADGHIGDPAKTLKQNLTRFSNVVRRFGITCSDAGGLGVSAHGLRHQYANDRYEAISGVASPVRAADGERASLDREADRAARLRVSEELGHSRESITGAYYGSTRRAAA